MIELLPFGVLVAYIFPFVIAAARGHDAVIPILVVNLLLGWTGVGWLFTLAWAAMTPAQGVGGDAYHRKHAASSVGRRSVNPRILHRTYGAESPPAEPTPQAPETAAP